MYTEAGDLKMLLTFYFTGIKSRCSAYTAKKKFAIKSLKYCLFDQKAIILQNLTIIKHISRIFSSKEFPSLK